MLFNTQPQPAHVRYKGYLTHISGVYDIERVYLHICQIQRVGTECKNRKDNEERTPLSVNIDLFQTDYGCDIEKGSVCTYHPGAVHCVRAIQAR